MPRNSKCRRVCSLPASVLFHAQGGSAEAPPETITVEQLEALRLCDREELPQEEAARRMNVSRGTFQRILYSARKTVASALCEGSGIRIAGGNYELAHEECGCRKRCLGCRFSETAEQSAKAGKHRPEDH